MDEDMFLEAEYEERYEGEDYNLWEEQQVFLDNEGADDAALDDYLDEVEHELSC
jgi:hypothetical protein